MLDTHCHIDQYDDPERVAYTAEQQTILTVAVTNLPSHYQLAVEHLAGFKNVHPALGLHPLAARDHESELPAFLRLIDEAKYIGEVGLDFSKTGIQTKDIQLASFRAVLTALKRSHKFVTVHSRGAEAAVLECLKGASVGPVCFHWFSGSEKMLKNILLAGHYLSFNPAMTGTSKWNELIRYVPRERVLTETDGPFSKCEARYSEPRDVGLVLEWIGRQWGCSCSGAEVLVAENFGRILNKK